MTPPPLRQRLEQELLDRSFRRADAEQMFALIWPLIDAELSTLAQERQALIAERDAFERDWQKMEQIAENRLQKLTQLQADLAALTAENAKLKKFAADFASSVGPYAKVGELIEDRVARFGAWRENWKQRAIDAQEPRT